MIWLWHEKKKNAIMEGLHYNYKWNGYKNFHHNLQVWLINCEKNVKFKKYIYIKWKQKWNIITAKCFSFPLRMKSNFVFFFKLTLKKNITRYFDNLKVNFIFIFCSSTESYKMIYLKNKTFENFFSCWILSNRK